MKSLLRDNDTEDFNRFRRLIYTPLQQAVEELQARQFSGLLDDLGRDGLLNVPPALKHPRTAVLFRQIGTPNYEMHHVVSLARQYDLHLVIWEYHADRFLARNPCKHALGRMGFFGGVGRNGGRKIRYANVIDFNRYDGAALSEVRTLWGQPLIEFHREILLAEYPQLSAENFFDASAWFKSHGGAARSYYKAFTMLFIRHAILFETFMLEGEELQFTRDIFLPALHDARDAFGVKPLVVYSETPEREGDAQWLMYPAHLHQHVLRHTSAPERFCPRQASPAY